MPMALPPLQTSIVVADVSAGRTTAKLTASCTFCHPPDVALSAQAPIVSAQYQTAPSATAFEAAGANAAGSLTPLRRPVMTNGRSVCQAV